MIQETMIYSVKTAVLGMLIVFSFLALLSLLMWAIKAFFAHVLSGEFPRKSDRMISLRKRGPVGRGGENEAKDTERAILKNSLLQFPEWLPIAVSVFLLMEVEDAETSAEPWRPLGFWNTQLWILSGVYEK